MERIEHQTFGALLEQIAAKSPTPGGGAVASATGAVSAALAGMVVSYSVGRKNLAEHQPALEQAVSTLRRAREIFLELAEEDAAAYALLNDLMKVPDTDPRRAREMPGTVQAALAPPRATIAASADLLRLYEKLAPITNRHLRSDLAIAALLAESAAKSGWWNVAANLSMIADAAERGKVREESWKLVEECTQRRAAIEKACAFDGM